MEAVQLIGLLKEITSKQQQNIFVNQKLENKY